MTPETLRGQIHAMPANEARARLHEALDRIVVLEAQRETLRQIVTVTTDSLSCLIGTLASDRTVGRMPDIAVIKAAMGAP